MTKNIIIAALAFSNLLLMASLIYVCVKWGEPAGLPAPDRAADATQLNDAYTGAQEFTFKAPGHFAGGAAPLILNRALTITATFNAQEKDGVIIAQGGLGQGYALYVQDGELWFALRRRTVLTTVSGGKVSAGPLTITATLDKTGQITIARDGSALGTGLVAGMITDQPVDGLDIGADRGEPIGRYQVPNLFGGTIEIVSLKVTP